MGNNDSKFANGVDNCSISDTEVDVVFCGKILLYRKEWQIRFSCRFCDKELPALPELLRHSFKHFPNFSIEKIEQLICGEQQLEECTDEFAELIEMVDTDEDYEEASHIETNELINHESTIEQNNTSFSNKYETFLNEINKDIKTVPEEADDFTKDFEAEKNEEVDEDYDDDYSKITESDHEDENSQSDAPFEFLDVATRESTATSVTIRLRHIKCSVCDQKFPNREKMEEHKNTHGEKPHICEICGVGFKEKYNLNIHRQRHLGIKPYKCKICDKTFTTATDRNIHRRVHTGERYECDDCGKTCLTKSRLKVHQRKHTNECYYLCNICGKSFYERHRLKDHMASHSNERPYRCKQCDGTFKTDKNLRTHVKLHSTEKKYSCSYCPKKFAQRAGVYSHERNIHKKKPAEPDEYVQEQS